MIFNRSEFVVSHMFLSATAWDLRRSLLRRKDFRIKLFDGVIFLLYFCWQEIKFCMLFRVFVEKAFWVFLSRKLLGDAFGHIFNSIVGFACFRLKHATIVIKGWCMNKLNRSRISVISRVDFKFDEPTLVQKTKVDWRHRSVIAPAKLGGSKQMRDVCFIW